MKKVVLFLSLVSLLACSDSGSPIPFEDIEVNTVRFNEIQVTNANYKDEHGDNPNWVEFYNPNNVVVRLKGFSLTDNENVPLWTFGDMRIEPGTYFTVFLSGRDQRDTVGKKNLHASFKLKKDGGKLFLLNSLNEPVDGITYPAEIRGLSYAKGADTWAFSEPPTPGTANSSKTYTGQATPPGENDLPKSGHYATAPTFTMPENVYCDRTGNLPTIYSDLKPGDDVTMDVTSTRIAILRCAKFAGDLYPSELVMRSYVIGRLPELPIVSIAVLPSDFSSKYNTTSGEYDLPIHVDFFEKGTAENLPIAWSHPAELSPMGAASRQFPKKSVVVSFKEKYGTKNIKYPLFPSHPHLTKFKHFILRNNGNNYENGDYIRDMLMTSLTEGLSIDYQKGRAVVVYYNGSYYGIHNMRERANSDYFETNYNIDENDVNLVKIVDPSKNNGIEVSRGSAADYQAVLTWLNGISTLSDADLKTLYSKIDVDNFTNHFQSRIFYNDRDWPGKNMKVWNTIDAKSPKIKFLMHDTDHGFGSWGTEACIGWTMLRVVTTESDGCQKYGWPNPKNSTLILRKLLTNQNYKNAFINRFSLLIATYFATTRVNERIDKLYNEVLPEISDDQTRWVVPSPGMRGISTVRSFATSRPASMQSEITSHFILSTPVDITINGYTHVDGLPIPSFAGSSVTFKAYPEIPMVLKWNGGEKTITPSSGATYTAGQ